MSSSTSPTVANSPQSNAGKESACLSGTLSANSTQPNGAQAQSHMSEINSQTEGDTPQLSPLESRRQRLEHFRSERIADTGMIYLGAPLDSQPGCHWARNGRENVLVYTKENVSANGEQTSDDDDGLSHDESSGPEAAILSLVCFIRPEGSWLKADAGFTGAGFIRTFTDAELSAAGAAPDTMSMPEAGAFVSDFNMATKNIKALQGLIATQGIESKGFSLPGKAPAFRFKHNLFERLEMDEVLTEEEKDLFTTWPRSNDAVTEALEQLYKQDPAKYRLRVLPAYDMHTALIDPGFYTSNLQGSIAEICFTLSHWSISAKEKKTASNTYHANIVDIMVLCPPPPTVVSPQKRKVSSYHPASLTKKRIISN